MHVKVKAWQRVPWLQVVMVNSTWTREHIASLWWTLLRPQIVYPPCNVAALAALPLDRKLKCLYMVSLAQVCHRFTSGLARHCQALCVEQQCNAQAGQ